MTRGELLLSAGLSSTGIERRVRRGMLLPEYPGVYRAGHRAPSTEATYMAAVKAGGDGAVLAGRAAAYLLQLLKGKPPPPEVITPTERRIEGLKTRRCRSIDPRDVATIKGIPVTTVRRTLVDLAADLEPDELARAFHEAAVRYRTKPSDVEKVLARHPNAPGAKKLRSIMTGDTRTVLSELERGFLSFLEKENLPLPKTNTPAGRHYVDCRWEEPPLTVELDSYRYHNSRYAWEQDHRREREARRRKGEYRRYSWGDVFEDPRDMLRELLSPRAAA